MERFKTPSILVFNKDMELQNTIANIASLTLTKNFFYPGSFGFEMPYSLKILDCLEDEDNFLVFEDGNIGLVNYINDEEKQKGEKIAEKFQVKGVLGLSLLNNRIAVPPSESEYDSLTNNVESISKHYIDSNFVNPADTNRVMPNFEIATDDGLGDEIYYQMRYGAVGDEMCALAEGYNLGHNIYFDKSLKKLVYDMYEGVDRSNSQSENRRVVFSKELGVLSTQGYKMSKKKYANYGIVGGSGSGVDRVIQEVGTATGWNRKEIFIDAKNYSSDNLEARGEEVLEKYKVSKSFPVVINSTAGSSTEYKVKWNLGDIITIKSKKYNKTEDLRVTEVTENYNKEGFELTAVIGDPEPGLSDALKRKFEEFESLKSA